MAVTIEEFRTNYPEFKDTVAYPDSAFDYWYAIALCLTNVNRWKPATIYNLGLSLFVAHQLVLERQALLTAQKGGMPGTQIGVLTSKQVDKVSAGYDATAVINPEDGHWAMTIYGLRYIRMVRVMGAGPIQVGAGSGFLSPLSSANAWAGPWPWNFPNMNM